MLDGMRPQDADDIHCIRADAFSPAAETSDVPFEVFPMVLWHVLYWPFRLMVSCVELWRIPVPSMDDGGLAVVRDQQLCYAAEIAVHVDMCLQPGILTFIRIRFGKRVLAVREHSDEYQRCVLFARFAIRVECRIADPVDLNLLIGLMMKMHGCLTAFLIQLDVMAELRILETQLVLESAFFQILRPEQLLVDSSMLQLSMDPLKIRQIAVRLRDFWRFGEHLGKDVVGLLIWQRPAEPSLLG